MSGNHLLPDAKRRTGDERPSTTQSVARRFGGLNALAGVLGLVGPAVWGNDDDGLVNTKPGRFLGLVAVNGPHALLHVLVGAVGVAAGRDASSARRYMGFTAAFFSVFAAVGWRQFGFEPGVHDVGVLAVDRWGTLGHVVLAAFSLSTLVQSDSRE